MGIRMPKPVKIGEIYYYRVRVPSDLKGKVENKRVAVTVGGAVRNVTVKDASKVSLRTKDIQEAKRRHTLVSAEVEARWEAERRGPERLTHKEALALAGDLYRTWVQVFDDDPGSPALWAKMKAEDASAIEPQLPAFSELMVNPKPTNRPALEQRYGGFVDAQLRQYGRVIDDESRQRLLELVAAALSEAARINLQKAKGDYSETGKTSKYPSVPRGEKQTRNPAEAPRNVPMSEIIDKEVKSRSAGRGGRPIRDRSVDKYRRVAHEFEMFRGSESIETITAKEADEWVEHLIDEGDLRNSSIKQRLGNLKTIVQWARKQSRGELFRKATAGAV